MTAKPTLASPMVAGSILIALALLHAPAAAQSSAMLPPGTPPDGPPASEEVRREAARITARALMDEGVTVLPAEDAQRRMVGEPFAECNELDCGADVVRSLGVDFAVLVTIWAPRGTPTSVVVTLIGPTDSVAGDAPVEGGALAPALESALTTALQRYQASQMGFIEVTSEPAGADVEVDGRVVGQTPLRHLVMAGQRTVRLHLEGYDPVERTVRVAATQEHPVDVTLAVATDAEATEPRPVATYTEPHWANWLIGGGLAAGGVAALISPIHTLARLGECTDSPVEDRCFRSVQFGVQSAVLSGIGLAALAAGVIFMAAQPLTLTTTVTTDSATLHLRGTF